MTCMEGVMIDLTSTLQRETEQTAREAVKGATSTRSVIDQARGILMGQLKMGSEDAFQMLVSTSSHRNVKLVVVAAELVQLANSAESRNYLDTAIKAFKMDGRGASAPRRAVLAGPLAPSRRMEGRCAGKSGRHSFVDPTAQEPS